MRRLIKLWLLSALIALPLSCNKSEMSNTDGGAQQFSDFPAGPILDTTGGMMVPGNVADLFGPAGSGAQSGGPCLIEPETGALFPRDWLRLRVRYAAPAGQNLFEIRLHVGNQTNDLVVYTRGTTW